MIIKPWKRKTLRFFTSFLIRMLTTRNGFLLRATDVFRTEWRHFQNTLMIYRLQSCGNDCSFNFPVRIEGPENVSLGDKVTMSPYVHIWGQGGVTIGNNTMIASHAAITSVTHNKNSSLYNEENLFSRVIIGSNVWIGTHAVILQGVEIGDNVIVGAGAIVTKNIPANTVVVGIPARKLGE